MRCKHVRLFAIVTVLGFIWFKFYYNFTFDSVNYALYKKSDSNSSSTKVYKRLVSELVTIVLRQFELHENDVTLTAQSFKSIFPNVNFWIVYRDAPYPPLQIDFMNNSNIKLYDLAPSLKRKQSLLAQIKTKYVLLIPDSIRITSQRPIELMIEALKKNPDDIIAASFGGYVKNLKCLRINLSQREWTIKYSLIKGSECDAVSGKHLIMMKKEILDQVSEPLLLPFPQSLYVQTSVQNLKVCINQIV